MQPGDLSGQHPLRLVMRRRSVQCWLHLRAGLPGHGVQSHLRRRRMRAGMSASLRSALVPRNGMFFSLPDAECLQSTVWRRCVRGRLPGSLQPDLVSSQRILRRKLPRFHSGMRSIMRRRSLRGSLSRQVHLPAEPVVRRGLRRRSLCHRLHLRGGLSPNPVRSRVQPRCL